MNYSSPTRTPPSKIGGGVGAGRRYAQSKQLKYFCVAQIACGGFLALASWIYLESTDAAWGLFLGLLTSLVGFLGLAGAIRRGLDIMNASFAGGMLVLALIIGFSGRVHRQAAVECALAQLLAMDDASRYSLDHSESWKGSAFSSVQLRLDALDTTLGLLQERADLVAPLRPIDRESASELLHEHQRALWAASDAQIISTKLAKAKQHGMKVLGQLLKHGIDPHGKVKQLETTAAIHLPAGDVEELQQRFNTLFANTERLVRRLRDHEEGGSVPVGPEEYPELLRSLEESMNNMAAFLKRMEVAVGKQGMPLTHDDFVKLMHGFDLEEDITGHQPALNLLPLLEFREEAEIISDALGRHSQTEDGYAAVRAIGAEALQQSWRQQWEAQLAAHLPPEGTDALSRLPQKCIEGSWGKGIVTTAVIAVVLLQCSAWFCMLSVAGSMPGSARVLNFDD